MTPHQAAWVRGHALTTRITAGAGGPDLMARCPCQWGPSGHCQAGRCGQCAHRLQAAWYEHGHPAAHLCARDGGVLAEVWSTGQPCRWRCSCACHRHGAETRAEDRGMLFDLEAA